MRANILVVYANRDLFPLKKTFETSIYCFSEYSQHRFFFVNASYDIPQALNSVQFDLVIFTTSAAGYLQYPLVSLERNPTYANLQRIKKINAVKVLIPQDEFLRSEVLCRMIKEFQIRHVFSVAPPSQWDYIYCGIDRNNVSFHSVLTGYLPNDIYDILTKLNKEGITREIDIGYRAWKAQYWVGRFGMLKQQIADQVVSYCNDLPLKLDVSTEPESTFFGLDWYRFLLRCRTVLGVEGGSSLLDADGLIRQKVCSYLKHDPSASFEQVEKACFAGMDGKLALFALSPRHLEACATKTCQVLVTGEYNGILKPGIHYIELKKDFSNLKEAITQLQNPSIRNRITERAYHDLVASGHYLSKTFAEKVLNTSLKGVQIKPKQPEDDKAWRRQRQREKRLLALLPYELAVRNFTKSILSEHYWMKLKRGFGRC